jgi:small-conductance mechanosensitive channel/ABC-type branched-subunit amino acid transport system substrate-binding protein
MASGFFVQAFELWNYLSKPQLERKEALRADGSKIDPMDVMLIADMSSNNKLVGSEMVAGFQDAIQKRAVSDVIRLVVRDYGGRVDAASALADGAAAAYRTLAMVGPTEFLSFKALNDSAKEGQVPAIIPIGPPSSLTTNKWSFSLMAPRFKRGQLLGRLMQNTVKGTRIGRFLPKGTIADGLWAGVVNSYADFGAESIEVIDWPTGQTDQQIKTLIAENLYLDAVLISLPMIDAQAVIRQLRLYGYVGTIFVERELAFPEFAESFSHEPKELIKPGYFTDGVIGLSPFVPTIAGDESQRLINSYNERKKTDPTWAYAYGYDSGLLIAAFVETSKRNNSFDLSNPDKLRSELLKYLENLNFSKDRLYGFTGALKFDTTHQRENPPKLVLFKNKQLLPYYVQFSEEPTVKPDEGNYQTYAKIADQYFQFVPVVYTGLLIKNIENVDFDATKFTATVDLSIKSREPLDIKDLEFENQIGDLKSTKLVEEINNNGTIFRHYSVAGEFSFKPLPGDILLDHTKINLVWRHRTRDAGSMKFVVDTDYQGIEAQKTILKRNDIPQSDKAFTLTASRLSVEDQIFAAPGDPRNFNGVIKFSTAAFNGEISRATSSFTSKLLNNLGASRTRLAFIFVSLAFMALSVVAIIFPKPYVMLPCWFILFLTSYLSKATFFTSSYLDSFEPSSVRALRLGFDIIYIFAITQFLDSIFILFLRSRSKKKDNQPVISFLIRFALYFGAVSYFYTVILGQDILPFLATASVGLTVVGLALQGLIFDAIAGIVINLDRHIATGQRIHVKTSDGSISGTVEQLGWRYVSIRSDDDQVHFVPNSNIATQVLSNLSLMQGFSRIEIPFSMSARVELDDMIPKLLAAVEVAIAKDPTVDRKRPAKIRIKEIDNQYLKCVVQMFTLSKFSRDSIRSKILDAIRKVLVNEGVLAGEEPVSIELNEPTLAAIIKEK